VEAVGAGDLTAEFRFEVVDGGGAGFDFGDDLVLFTEDISPALGHPLAGVGVARSLLGDMGEGVALLFGLDDAEGLAVNEEDVVGGAAVGLKLPHRDARAAERFS
tara:strand:- start:22 stop:336 length:315 start_codon:yes stop_codon:yes gene_type:complete